MCFTQRRCKRLVHLADPMHEEHVIGAKRAIDHQLADPMAVGLLLAQEIPLRERDRFREFLIRGWTRCTFCRDAGQSDDVGGGIPHSGGHEACAAGAAFLPVRCPLPEVTPLYAVISLPLPVGFGFAPKLKRTVFQVSPGCALRPRLAVGS